MRAHAAPMLAFRLQETLFTHTIAARDKTSALVHARDVIKSNQWRDVAEWYTPDPWTRRTVAASIDPHVVDTVPRFVLDTCDGPHYDDLDSIYPERGKQYLDKWRGDSAIHAAWIDAIVVEYERGEALRHHVGLVVSERDPARFATLSRALAGAFGLGPVASWFAEALPALIALDIEAEPLWSVPPDFYTVGKREMKATLARIRRVFDGDKRGVAIDYIMRQLCGQGASHTRANVVMALCELGWLPPKTYGEAVMCTLPPP